MLGLSTKSIYGLAAMYELSKKDPNKPTKIKEIAQKGEIPQNFLEQILLELKKAGMLVSVKGAHGGYKLAKEPSEILIYDIVNTLEDNLFNITDKVDNPVLKLYWRETTEKFEQLFKAPLSDLNLYEQKIEATLTYTI